MIALGSAISYYCLLKFVSEIVLGTLRIFVRTNALGKETM